MYTSLVYSVLALLFVFLVPVICPFPAIFSRVLSSDLVPDSDLLKWAFFFFQEPAGISQVTRLSRKYSFPQKFCVI